MNKLIAQAQRILRENDCGDYTRPSLQYCPHQWAWDSGFVALGWSYISHKRAVTELASLFEGQWSDGRVPAIKYNTKYLKDYFPGPSIWGQARSFAVTQPPVWALMIKRVWDGGIDLSLFRDLIPHVEKAHQFYRHQRDPLGWNLVALAHPRVSGQDNSPAWDVPLQKVDIT